MLQRAEFHRIYFSWTHVKYLIRCRDVKVLHNRTVNNMFNNLAYNGGEQYGPIIRSQVLFSLFKDWDDPCMSPFLRDFSSVTGTLKQTSQYGCKFICHMLQNECWNCVNRSSGLVNLKLRLQSNFLTPFSPISILSIGGYGLSPLLGMLVLSSEVNAVGNCSFRICAFWALSLWRKPSLFLRGDTPAES